MSFQQSHSGPLTPEAKRPRVDMALYGSSDTPSASVSLVDIARKGMGGDDADAEETVVAKRENENLRRKMRDLERQLSVEKRKQDLLQGDKEDAIARLKTAHQLEIQEYVANLQRASDSLALRVVALSRSSDEIKGLKEDKVRLEKKLQEVNSERTKAVQELMLKENELRSELIRERKESTDKYSILLQSLDVQTNNSRIANATIQSVRGDIANQQKAMMTANQWLVKEEEYKKKISHLEDRVDTLSRQGTSEEDSRAMEAMKSQLKAQDNLQDRLATLELDNKNMAAVCRRRVEMAEKILSLENRLKATERLQEDHASLQVQYDNLVKSQSNEKISGLESQLKSMQQERLLLVHQISEMKAEATEQSEKIMHVTSQLTTTVEEKLNIQATLKVAEESRRSQLRRANFYEIDRNNHKRYLDMFVNDETAADGIQEQAKVLTESLDHHKTRVSELEANLEKEIQRAIEAEKERDRVNLLFKPMCLALEAADTLKNGRTENSYASESDVQSLKERISKQEDEITRLTDEIKKNEKNVLDSNRTKIISPIESPLVIKLRDDLKVVREALAAAQQGKVSSEEVMNLRLEVKKKEKALAVFKEKFRKQYDTIRGGFLHLFGYRLDMAGDDQVRLRSIYGEHDTDLLLFTLNNGTVTLLDTDYFNTISLDHKKYLTEGQSVPAFLSSLTLDLQAQARARL